MLINLSNHPSSKWSKKQLEAAGEYGEIVDIPFPVVDPYGSSEYIDGLVDVYYEKICSFGMPTVMLQGEFLFTFRLVTKLKAAGLRVIAGCSERRTIEYIDAKGYTTKKSEFEFVGFKEY